MNMLREIVDIHKQVTKLRQFCLQDTSNKLLEQVTKSYRKTLQVVTKIYRLQNVTRTRNKFLAGSLYKLHKKVIV